MDTLSTWLPVVGCQVGVTSVVPTNVRKMTSQTQIHLAPYHKVPGGCYICRPHKCQKNNVTNSNPPGSLSLGAKLMLPCYICSPYKCKKDSVTNSNLPGLLGWWVNPWSSPLQCEEIPRLHLQGHLPGDRQGPNPGVWVLPNRPHAGQQWQ